MIASYYSDVNPDSSRMRHFARNFPRPRTECQRGPHHRPRLIRSSLSAIILSEIHVSSHPFEPRQRVTPLAGFRF